MTDQFSVAQGHQDQQDSIPIHFIYEYQDSIKAAFAGCVLVPPPAE